MAEKNLPPTREKKKYDQDIMGIYGALGNGDTKISYIQTSLTIDKIDSLGLVSEIPGSEKWPIRQLFQRDIDSQRVKDEIIPYFKNSSMAKFFNPLTIAVLPINKGGSFSDKLQEKVCEPSSHFENGGAYEIPNFYKVSYSNIGSPSWGELQWNSSEVKLIAIDGQHRLSALKRLQALHHKDPTNSHLQDIGFSSWSVPIVLVTVGHVDTRDSHHVILEKTRNIFVTINKQARPPSRSRTILLNDYSVTAICCQEVLDSCKDTKGHIPLAVFDWREFRSDNRSDASPHLLSVDELEDLMIHYLLGEDDKKSGRVSLSEEQEQNLFVDDMVDKIKADMGDDEKRKLIKLRFGETILPAFHYVLSNILPYSSYLDFLKNKINNTKTDTESHAWSRLVYGSDYAPVHIESEMHEETLKIIEDCQKEKSKLGYIFSKAVGIRSVFSGFAIFAETYRASIKVENWLPIAEIFVNSFNGIYKDANFDKGSKMIRHIAEDHNENIVNYKLEQVRSGLGNLIAFIALKNIEESDVIDLSSIEERIEKTLVSGFRKEVRPKVKEELSDKPSEDINKEVIKRAQNEAKKHLKQIIKKLDKDRNSSS